jgi:hypothetical protein
VLIDRITRPRDKNNQRQCQRSPLVRFVDSGGSGDLLALLAWEYSGSGSARHFT